MLVLKLSRKKNVKIYSGTHMSTSTISWTVRVQVQLHSNLTCPKNLNKLFSTKRSATYIKQKMVLAQPTTTTKLQLKWYFVSNRDLNSARQREQSMLSDLVWKIKNLSLEEFYDLIINLICQNFKTFQSLYSNMKLQSLFQVVIRQLEIEMRKNLPQFVWVFKYLY